MNRLFCKMNMGGLFFSRASGRERRAPLAVRLSPRPIWTSRELVAIEWRMRAGHEAGPTLNAEAPVSAMRAMRKRNIVQLVCC